MENERFSRCVTPDFPYCPACPYGIVDIPDPDDPSYTPWVCALDCDDGSCGKTV